MASRPSAEDTDESGLVKGIKDNFQYGYDNAKEVAKMLIRLCADDPELKQQTISRLERKILDIIKAELTQNMTTKIMQQVMNDIPENESADANQILKDCENFGIMSKERIEAYEATLTDAVLKKHPQYKSFMTFVESGENEQASGDDENDDSEVEEQEGNNGGEQDEESDVEACNDSDELPIVDPFTKKELKHPVRNKKCGHIYERESTTELIKKEPKIKCPIAGCSNKEFLKTAHLAGDRKLTLEIRKKQKKAKKDRK